MPACTSPNTVYLPSRCGASRSRIEKDVSALLGSPGSRAIDRVPTWCGTGVSSAGSLVIAASCSDDSARLRFWALVSWTTYPGSTRLMKVESYTPRRTSLRIWATCRGARSG